MAAVGAGGAKGAGEEPWLQPAREQMPPGPRIPMADPDPCPPQSFAAAGLPQSTREMNMMGVGMANPAGSHVAATIGPTIHGRTQGVVANPTSQQRIICGAPSIQSVGGRGAAGASTHKTHHLAGPTLRERCEGATSAPPSTRQAPTPGAVRHCVRAALALGWQRQPRPPFATIGQA